MLIDIANRDLVQTEEMCLEAVRSYGLALCYVQNQTEAICLEAVKQNWCALRYVVHRTEAICMEAVKQNWCALKFVKNETEAICMYAVATNAMALQYVHNQTEDMCVCAVKQYGMALQYVDNQTETICIHAVKEFGLALKYVVHQTDAICLEAFACHSKHNFGDVEFFDIYRIIEHPTPQLIVRLIDLYPSEIAIIMTDAVIDLLKYYEASRYAIVMHIIQYLSDLLYRPNNIGALLIGHSRWHAVNCAKTLFLTL
jgi:Domain of unknown function (DUF4116)